MPQPAKKTLNLSVLDILRRYSDEDHRLSQKDIADILRTEYDLSVDRKSVRRNILSLMESGYEIEYSESIRMVRNRKTGEMEESYIWSDFYLVRDFTDSELRLLIDGLLFSKHIPYSQCKELVEKLEKLSNVYFRSRTKYIHTMPDTIPPNKQLFYTIDVLDEAISRNKQVAFHYTSFGIDKKRHPRMNDTGKEKEYIVSPYQIAAANGRYYLICNTDPHDNVSHYRLDRIADIRPLESAATPMKKVRGLEHGLNLPKHMAEHLYMFSGKSEAVSFRMKKHLINDVIDWFGTDISFADESEDAMIARVTVNRKAMRLWAIQYAPYVRVLTPQSLADEIQGALRDALEQYQDHAAEQGGDDA